MNPVIKLSDNAAARIIEIMSGAEKNAIGVRVSVKSGGDLISIKSDKNYHVDIGSTVMANISPNLCLLFDSETGQMLEN